MGAISVMNLLEISIHRRAGGRWPGGAQLTTSNDPLSMRRVGTLELDLDRVKQAVPRTYGIMLGRALFKDEVLDTFRQALAKADCERQARAIAYGDRQASTGVEGSELHVMLFVEADELKSLHWER